MLKLYPSGQTFDQDPTDDGATGGTFYNVLHQGPSLGGNRQFLAVGGNPVLPVVSFADPGAGDGPTITPLLEPAFANLRVADAVVRWNSKHLINYSGITPFFRNDELYIHVHAKGYTANDLDTGDPLSNDPIDGAPLPRAETLVAFFFRAFDSQDTGLPDDGTAGNTWAWFLSSVDYYDMHTVSTSGVSYFASSDGIYGALNIPDLAAFEAHCVAEDDYEYFISSPTGANHIEYHRDQTTFALTFAAFEYDFSITINGVQMQVPNGTREINRVFADLTKDDLGNGAVDYACLFVRNLSGTATTETIVGPMSGVFLGDEYTFGEQDGPIDGITIEVGVDPAAADTATQVIPDRYTAPTGVTFGAAVDVGPLAPSESRAVWLRRTVQPLTKTYENKRDVDLEYTLDAVAANSFSFSKIGLFAKYV